MEHIENELHKEFNEANCIHSLHHYLPTQAPLKDFIHHNTLHAFQGKEFHTAMNEASAIFGYNVYLEMEDYRLAFQEGKITEEAFNRSLEENIPVDHLSHYRMLLLTGPTQFKRKKRIGQLRNYWKQVYKIDMDSRIHPHLFRLVSSYLDQGISTWDFPNHENGFLASIRGLEARSFSSSFRSKRVLYLLNNPETTLTDLLHILVGDESLFERYLFDQQFAHPGWSGMVAVLENSPHTLLKPAAISLHDFIMLECLMEIDILDDVFGKKWDSMIKFVDHAPTPLFSKVKLVEQYTCFKIWQEAYEWSYYDRVLQALQSAKKSFNSIQPSFQALFCMDDRECSIRRYLEAADSNCQTFGTPGHFNLEFYFRPEDSKFNTKVCPAPASPKIVVKEFENTFEPKKEMHFSATNHGFFGGIFMTTIAGWLSIFRLARNIIKPSMSPLTSSSSKHMDVNSRLEIESDGSEFEDGLQVGFTVDQMTDRLEGMLKSIGLVENFAPIVYAFGHGSTSVNNTHYAGYDCGACSGRPGSVNARVMSFIANHKEVRKLLKLRGITIPETTVFIGGLHDTSRDEMTFFEVEKLSEMAQINHTKQNVLFEKCLDSNAKERSRRFMSIETLSREKDIHKLIKTRTVSLFEPRPELNHATNALCIVGRRDFSKDVFLDRRAFMNSFDYRVDPQGKYLEGILNAVAPVAGGINLEYYFSRVDNQQLGAGSKLPHNVVGLIGVSNGIDGDLRTGLPYQMVEVHDPVRLMVIVEHFPGIVLETINRNASTLNWFRENWVHLIVSNPDTGKLFRFQRDHFVAYEPSETKIEEVADIVRMIESTHENLSPVYIQKPISWKL